MDPAIERRLAHLDGDEEHLVEREEHRNGEQHRHAARQRIGLLALVQLHHRQLLLLRIVAMAASSALPSAAAASSSCSWSGRRRSAAGRRRASPPRSGPEWRGRNCRRACRRWSSTQKKGRVRNQNQPQSTALSKWLMLQIVLIAAQDIHHFGAGEQPVGDTGGLRRARGCGRSAGNWPDRRPRRPRSCSRDRRR